MVLVNRAAMLRAWLRSLAANSSAAATCQARRDAAQHPPVNAALAARCRVGWVVRTSMLLSTSRLISASLQCSAGWVACTSHNQPHLHMVGQAGQVVHAALVQGARPHTSGALQLLCETLITFALERGSGLVVSCCGNKQGLA
jgi:hypothetical protein